MSGDRWTPDGVPLAVAAARARLSTAWVRTAIRLGLVQPMAAEGRVVVFTEDQVSRLRRIRRLRDDLGLNLAGIEVVMRLLDRIEADALESVPRAPSSRHRSKSTDGRAGRRPKVVISRLGGEPWR